MANKSFNHHRNNCSSNSSNANRNDYTNSITRTLTSLGTVETRFFLFRLQLDQDPAEPAIHQQQRDHRRHGDEGKQEQTENQ